MSFDQKIYDPDQWSISFAGIPIQGFADGEFLTVEYDSDDFSDVVGTDGEVTRSKSNDRRATVTLKLMQTSLTNDRLSAFLLLDKTAPGGAGVAPFIARDRSGRAIYTAEKAWIAQGPAVSLDRTATSREWKLRCAELIANHGGA